MSTIMGQVQQDGLYGLVILLENSGDHPSGFVAKDQPRSQDTFISNLRYTRWKYSTAKDISMIGDRKD